jgi:hypothetical protein
MRDSFKCRCRRDGLDRLQRRDTAGAGIYRCSLGGGTLIALGVNDDQCADRNSFWNGTFTRRNATHADPRPGLRGAVRHTHRVNTRLSATPAYWRPSRSVR